MTFIMLQTIENETDRNRLTNFYIQYYALMKKKAAEVLSKFGLSNDTKLSEDIIHDAMARLIRNLHTVTSLNEPQLVGYAIKAVQSCAYDCCRKAISQQNLVESKGILEGAQEEKVWEDPVSYFVEEDPLIRLGHVLDKLPQRDHDILIYKYFLDYSDKKIADLLGIKEGSVRMALVRARRRVKESWEMPIKEKANDL